MYATQRHDHLGNQDGHGLVVVPIHHVFAFLQGGQTRHTRHVRLSRRIMRTVLFQTVQHSLRLRVFRPFVATHPLHVKRSLATTVTTTLAATLAATLATFDHNGDKGRRQQPRAPQGLSGQSSDFVPVQHDGGPTGMATPFVHHRRSKITFGLVGVVDSHFWPQPCQTHNQGRLTRKGHRDVVAPTTTTTTTTARGFGFHSSVLCSNHFGNAGDEFGKMGGTSKPRKQSFPFHVGRQSVPQCHHVGIFVDTAAQGAHGATEVGHTTFHLAQDAHQHSFRLRVHRWHQPQQQRPQHFRFVVRHVHTPVMEGQIGAAGEQFIHK